MATADSLSPRRVLSPIDRLSEILFGLIMVLTFTGSLSIAEAGREDVRTMLIAAIGCNVAWGVIDAILYLMGALAERGQNLRALRAVRQAAVDPLAARQLVADALPPTVASVLKPEEFDALRQRLAALPEPAARARLDRETWLGALGVFLLVVVSTCPVVAPFLFMENALTALRVSNAIAIVMLLLAGYAFADLTGRRPWLTGLGMVALGATLVGLTMALGG